MAKRLNVHIKLTHQYDLQTNTCLQIIWNILCLITVHSYWAAHINARKRPIFHKISLARRSICISKFFHIHYKGLHCISYLIRKKTYISFWKLLMNDNSNYHNSNILTKIGMHWRVIKNLTLKKKNLKLQIENITLTFKLSFFN